MILILIGIIALIIIILLLWKIFNKKKEYDVAIIVSLLIWLGIPTALATILMGIFEPTKMGEWKVKEAIEPTLLSSDEKDILGEYTYQYLIPERWSMKPYILNYAVDTPLENTPPILVRCERKGEPTIWTLGLRSKETTYVLYNSDDTINAIKLE